MSNQVVEELRRKVAETRQKYDLLGAQLKEEQTALQVVERMYGVQSSAKKPQGIIAGAQARGEGTVTRLGGPSLSGAVSRVLPFFGDDEFSVSDVEAEILDKGIMPDVKTPRAQISMTLKKLVEKGDLHRTHEGNGSEPHRYCRSEIPMTSFADDLLSD